MRRFEAFKKDNIVTKFEITVVFLLPVGSLLARKADYRLVPSFIRSFSLRTDNDG